SIAHWNSGRPHPEGSWPNSVLRRGAARDPANLASHREDSELEVLVDRALDRVTVRAGDDLAPHRLVLLVGPVGERQHQPRRVDRPRALERPAVLVVAALGRDGQLELV